MGYIDGPANELSFLGSETVSIILSHSQMGKICRHRARFGTKLAQIMKNCGALFHQATSWKKDVLENQKF